MFEFTCPKCRKTFSTDAIPSGKVTPCGGCGQRLRVVAGDGDAGVSLLASGERPATETPGRGWVLPVLAGACGLCGLMVAAGILLLWAAFGRGPSAEAKVAANKEDKPVASAGPAPKDPPKSDGNKHDPIKDGAAKETAKDDGAAKETAKDNGGTKETAKDDGGTKAAAKDDSGAKETVIKGPATLSANQVYNKLLNSCVWIKASYVNSEGKLKAWTGTGVLVDRDERLVVTNEHVAPLYAATIQVLFPDKRGGTLNTDPAFYMTQFDSGKAIAAEVVPGFVDRARDLSLIKLGSVPQGAAAVLFASHSPSPGQELHAIGGQPEGSRAMWIYNPGAVRQVAPEVWQYEDGFRRSAVVIESTMPINHGDSGGPVVDGRCLLVGVNSSYNQNSRQNSAHIDVTEIRDLLTKYFRSVGKQWRPDDEPPPDADVAQKVQKLVQALDGADADVRRRAALALADFGRDALEAVPALLKLLRAPNQTDEVRKAAARALSEIGTPTKDDLAALIDALRDGGNKAARVYAADALGKLGVDAKPAVPDLATALKDVEVEVRVNAAGALGKIGVPARQEAYAALLALLQDKEEEVRIAACGALFSLGDPTAADYDAVRALLTDQASSREGRFYAAAALSVYGPQAIPALTSCVASDPDPTVVRMACSSLGQVGAGRKDAALALGTALDHRVTAVRKAAAVALAQLGVDASTLPVILKALGMKDAECGNSILSVVHIGAFVKEPTHITLPKESLDDLKAALSYDDHTARVVAAYLLGTLGADAAPAAPDLGAALSQEKNERYRMEMLCAIGAIGPGAKDAGPALMEVVNDPTAPKYTQICAAVAVTLVGVRETDKKACYAVLVKSLEQPGEDEADSISQELRARGQKALQKGRRAAADAIANTYVLVAKQPELIDQDAKKAVALLTALRVLAKIGHPATGRGDRSDAVATFLRTILNDPTTFPTDIQMAANDAFVAIYK